MDMILERFYNLLYIMVTLWRDGPGMIKGSYLSVVHNEINPENLQIEAEAVINEELSNILEAHVPLWKDRTEDLRDNIKFLSNK